MVGTLLQGSLSCAMCRGAGCCSGPAVRPALVFSQLAPRVQKCDEEECDVMVGGAKVPLQRISIQLPASHGLVGLQFVVRSDDSTRWWKVSLDAGRHTRHLRTCHLQVSDFSCVLSAFALCHPLQPVWVAKGHICNLLCRRSGWQQQLQAQGSWQRREDDQQLRGRFC